MIRRIVATVVAVLLATALVPSPAGAAQQGLWWQSTWQMSQVWQLTDGTGITVAVIDTGVNASVPELAGAVVPGTDLTGQGSDGIIDHDPDSHGTAMASLIASRGGNSEVTGVAPGSTILPIATDNPRLEEEGIDLFATSIRYAVDHGAQVINISKAALALGSSELCPDRVAAAVRYAVSRDVVVVAGSGNTPGGQAPFPASCPGVVTVGAVDADLEPWENSHRSEHVDVAAPGVGLSSIGQDGELRLTRGTSLSTALVSGVVALLWSQFPDASADQVVARLLATVQDIGEPGRDDATGHGLVRPYEALTEPVPPNAPNPIYDGLDLTDVADPEPEDRFPAPPTAPVLPEPPTVATGDGGGSPLPVLLAIAAVLLAAALLTVLLVRRRARRQRRQDAQPAMSIME